MFFPKHKKYEEQTSLEIISKLKTQYPKAWEDGCNSVEEIKSEIRPASNK